MCLKIIKELLAGGSSQSSLDETQTSPTAEIWDIKQESHNIPVNWLCVGGAAQSKESACQ